LEDLEKNDKGGKIVEGGMLEAWKQFPLNNFKERGQLTWNQSPRLVHVMSWKVLYRGTPTEVGNIMCVVGEGAESAPTVVRWFGGSWRVW
jgi:hypothetical protein